MANTAKPKTGRQHNNTAAGSKISDHRWAYQRHNKRGGEEQNHEDDQLGNKNRGDNVAQRGSENGGGEKSSIDWSAEWSGRRSSLRLGAKNTGTAGAEQDQHRDKLVHKILRFYACVVLAWKMRSMGVRSVFRPLNPLLNIQQAANNRADDNGQRNGWQIDEFVKEEHAHTDRD